MPRGSGAYTYYPNGALKSDDNEQITNIIYDTFLKQPIEVVLSDGRKIKHFYDGLGRLFKTVYYSDATTVLETWDFIGGIILKNGMFYQMATPEGRAIFVSNAWQYEFDYKDHLGNTRVSFKANGNNLEKNSETAFDPYGVRLPIGVNNAFQNRYEFLNREKESTFGLNRINLLARTYNPTTGRFDRIDPKSSEMPNWTPYRYAFDNPIRFLDLDGEIEVDPQTIKNYPNFVAYAKSLEKTYMSKPAEFRQAFKDFSGLSDKQIKDFVTYGSGPKVSVENLDVGSKQINGITVLGLLPNGNLVNANSDGSIPEKGGKGLIKLDDDVVGKLENAKTGAEFKAGTLLVESTLFHEGVHYGTGVNKTNEQSYTNKGTEKGKEFEKKVYGVDVGRTNANNIANPVIVPLKPKPFNLN